MSLASAQTLAAGLPPLLAEAQHLAQTVVIGDHGRRRAGIGDAFWQFRPAQAGDSLRGIDWRRSARSDEQFLRETEWQIAQTVSMWVDPGASMRFASGDVTKADRAQILSLSLSILLLRGGERVGLTGGEVPPKAGQTQIAVLADALAGGDPVDDFAEPSADGMIPQSRAVMVSDFLGDISAVTETLATAADRGVSGAMLMVLDPSERAFPFHGRTIFESMQNTVRFETQNAGDLRVKYLAKLEDRIETLTGLCRLAGWQFSVHDTSASAQSALLWLYQALGRPA